MQVFARKGYLAVRPAAAVPQLRGSGVAALDGGSRPRISHQCRRLRVPGRRRERSRPIVVQVNTRDLPFTVDQEKATYAAQATIVARIKTRGASVLTLSQQYILTGTAKDLDAARQGEILFYRQPELAPGVYNLQAIVYDALSERASARFSTVTVPASRAAAIRPARWSSFAAPRRCPPAERTPNLPFYYGDLLLYPNAGEPLRRGRRGADVLLRVLSRRPRRRRRGYTRHPEQRRLLASTALGVAPRLLRRTGPARRDAAHDKPPAGTYEIRLRLEPGEEEQLRTTFFTIAG